MNSKKAKKLRRALKAVEKNGVVVTPHKYRTLKKMYMKGIVSFLILFALSIPAFADKLYFGMDKSVKEIISTLKKQGLSVETDVGNVSGKTFATLTIEGNQYCLNTLVSVDENDLNKILGAIHGKV